MNRNRSSDKDRRKEVIKLSNRFAKLKEEGDPKKKDEKSSGSMFMIGRRSIFELAKTRKSLEKMKQRKVLCKPTTTTRIKSNGN